MKTSKKMHEKGDGHIFKRGSVYYLQFSVEGNRKTVSLGTKLKREAKKKRDEYLEPKRANTKEEITLHIARSKRLISESSLTLDNVWQEFIKTSSRPNSSEGTLGNYERCWNRFKTWVEGKPETEETDNNAEVQQKDSINSRETIKCPDEEDHEIDEENLFYTPKKGELPPRKLTDITSEISQKYVNRLWSRGISGNTFNYHIKALCLITKTLLKNSDNPWSAANITRKQRIKVKAREALTTKQIEDLISFFDKPACSLENRKELKLLFTIGAFTGLRLADAVLLRWDCVNMKTNEITLIPLKTRKTQREVHIPIHPTLKSQLTSAEKPRTNDYVMPALVASYQNNANAFRKMIVGIFKSLGYVTTVEIENSEQRKNKANQFGFHSLRHSLATTAANNGVSITVLADILGDRVETIEDYYTHIKMGTKRKAIETLSPPPKGTKNPKTPNEKISAILKMLSSKKDLTKTGKKIFSLLSTPS